MQSPSLKEVIALTESALRGCVTRIEQDALGASNAVYFIALTDGQDYVVRISLHDQPELVDQEVWAIAQLRALGVPVPDILAADASLRQGSEWG